MDDSFFRSHWTTPFYPVYNKPSTRGIPVHDARTAASPRVLAVQPKQRIRSAEPSKVVTVPVHFVDTDRKRSQSESDSALRIQKVLRGFMVRKSVKKIADVRREVDKIEKRILARETGDLIRRDSRERLRVTEMLMSLLLRLDSVRGVDAGVRDCRKTVIQKVIALQEALDAIVAVDETSATETADAVAETIAEEAVEIAEEVKLSVNEEKPSDPCLVTQTEHRSADLIGDEPDSAVLATETVETEVPQNQTEPPPEATEITYENTRNEAEGEREATIERTESQTDSSAKPESPVERNEEKMETGGEGKQKSEEILERMMEENERMMEMMTELFERNDLQTRLLSSLSQRVEQLEKAFVCDRLRRKKKRHAASTKGKAPVQSPDVNKEL